MAAARFGNLMFRWVRPPSGMGAECRRRAEAMEPELLGQMSTLKGSMDSYMQSNIPWTDRTRAARDGLKTSVGITGKGGVTITAWHTVPYGGFLETGTSKMDPFPIIRPTLEAHYADAKKVMANIAGSG
jgi:HK97 gp10 family phage protein